MSQKYSGQRQSNFSLLACLALTRQKLLSVLATSLMASPVPYPEVGTGFRTGNHELSMTLLNNLRSENHGAVQLDWTFPIWRGLSGHAQYFNGYGESMIDYNQRVERFGLGLILSDLY